MSWLQLKRSHYSYAERRLTSKAFAVDSKKITVPFLYSYLDLAKDRVEKIHQTMLVRVGIYACKHWS